MTRITRHLLLAAMASAATLAVAAVAPPGEVLDRVSLTWSWLCLLLFAAALLVGPLHALRTGRLVTNHLLRRDLGVWCAAAGLAHLALAFEISMNPAYMQVYVDGASAWPAPGTRRLLYMWAVIGSLVIAALFALLLALSNNAALRLLRPLWWKRLQRSSYLAFSLTVAHGVAFQVIEARSTWLVAALGLLTLTVVTAQLAGWSRLRSRRPIGGSA
jgi:DMSO/TMAO reductase YedYZ heme-binding membrane subunit